MSHLPCSMDSKIRFKSSDVVPDTSELLQSTTVGDYVIFSGPLWNRLAEAYAQHSASDWETFEALCTTESHLDCAMLYEANYHRKTLSPGWGTEYGDPTSVQLVEYKSSPVMRITKIDDRESSEPLKRMDIEAPPRFVKDGKSHETWRQFYEELDRARNERSDVGRTLSTFYWVTQGQAKGSYPILCYTDGLMERADCERYAVRNLQRLQKHTKADEAFEIVTIDLDKWLPGATRTVTSE